MDPEQCLRFLSRVGDLLDAEPLLDEALSSVLRLAVPDLADWAVLGLLQPEGAVSTLAAPATPTRSADAVAESAQAALSASPEPGLYADLHAAAAGPEYRQDEMALLLHRSGFASAVVVPLRAGQQTVGSLTLAVSQPARQYSESQALLASELARRLALHIESDRLRQQSAEAIRARDRVLSVVSHDLRTPLTTIHGIVQLLLRRADKSLPVGSPQIADRLALVQRAALQLASLIEEILDSVRLEEDRPLDLHLRDLDLVRLVRDLAAGFADGSDASRIEIKPSTVELSGVWDAARLERVLAKLLGNALRESPEAAAVTVTLNPLALPSGERWAEVSIRDGGSSTTPAVPSSPVEPAQTPEDTPRNRGRLDLSGCRKIIAQHGGTLVVEGRPGAGAAVTVRLPLETSERDG